MGRPKKNIKQIDYSKMFKLSSVLKYKCDYNFIFGERSNGKSYQVKHYSVEHFMLTGRKFIYVRRFDMDIKLSLNNQYFSNVDIVKCANKTHFKLEDNFCYGSVECKGNKIYLIQRDSSENILSQKHIGYVMAIAQAQRYSSGSYEDVDIIFLEEFISISGNYLPREVTLFKHIISTVARKRKVQIFCIGNTLSRLCPYFKEFGITEIDSQVEGSAEVYEIDESDYTVRILSFYCENVGIPAEMLFGSDSKMSNKGEWLTESVPKLDDVEEWKTLYQFLIEYENKRFLISYMTKKGELALYISDGGEHVTTATTRIFGNRTDTNPMYTRGLKTLHPIEKTIFEMIQSHAFYENDLVGTEFKFVWKKMRLLDL